MIFQLQAGYILENIRDNFNNDELKKLYPEEQIKGLLFYLSHFDVETNSVDFSQPIDNINPLFATLNNLISRGLPTRPSLFIEETINKLFDLFEKQIDKTGTIKFVNKSSFEHSIIFQQLHLIDNTLILNQNNYLTSNLGSSFESEFLFNHLAPKHNFLLQILETQKKLTRIINNNDFVNQRVDFSIEYPYLVNGKRGLIIEIDGKHYHSDINQQILDNQRNFELQRAEWEVIRLSNTNEIQIFISNILSNSYLQTSYNIYLSKIQPEILDFYNQIIFVPIAIARIHKILIELILRGVLLLNSEKWKIAIIEQDIPCAWLAISDFEQLCFNPT